MRSFTPARRGGGALSPGHRECHSLWANGECARGTPEFSTIRAASGSAQMLNSADGVTSLMAWPPPRTMISGSSFASSGRSRSAMAMLVRGPSATKIGEREGSVGPRYMRMMKLTASSACLVPRAEGISSSAASAFGPCDRPSRAGRPWADFWNSARTRGLLQPAYTGTSTAPMYSRTRRVFSVTWFRALTPSIVVAAISSISGFRAAYMSATASSLPVSQSMITRRGAGAEFI